MKLNAVQTHEEICKWIESSITENQLNVLTLFIIDTFATRFPESENPLHRQLTDHMLSKISAKTSTIHVVEFVQDSEGNITYTDSPTNH